MTGWRPDSTRDSKAWRCFGSEAVERSKDWVPEAARESPRGVKTRRKNRITAAKKRRDTKSRRRHCRWFVGPTPELRCFDDGRFRWPIELRGLVLYNSA